MNKRQEARLSMYHTLRGICEKYSALWSSFAPFAMAYALFLERLEDIQQAALGQRRHLVTNAGNKQALREALIPRARKLSTALKMYAVTYGNDVLANDARVTVHDLRRKSADAFIGMLRQLHALGQEHLTALAPFGITAASQEALLDGLESFCATVRGPRHTRMARAESTAKLKAAYSAMTQVLTQRLDAAALLLGDDQPDFYNHYRNGRIIVDNPTYTRALTVQVFVDAGGLQKPVHGAVAIIDQGNLKRTTGARGRCYFQKLPPGTYTLNLVKEGLKLPAEIRFEVVKGQMTRVNAVMEAEE